MKKIVITLSGILLFSFVHAQTVKTEKWPNGNKRSEGIVLGTGTVNPSSSKEEQARQLNNLVKDGKWSTWFEDGKVRSEENYTKGVMTGVWKSWYENGQLESDINFTAGKAVFYYQSGAKNSEGTMASGMIHTGKWVAYYENGKKNYEGSYTAEGQKDGLWTWYNEQGVTTTEQTYQNGALVSSNDK